MTTIVVLLIVITVETIVCQWLFRVGLKKQTSVDQLTDLLFNREEFILSMLGTTNNILRNLETIHAKELFEKDDEVGVIWTMLYEQVKKLEGYTHSIEESVPIGKKAQ